MNIYFDTEFTELSKQGQLISLGMISDDNKSIYCEFEGIDTESQSDWLKHYVLRNTVLYGNKYIDDIIYDNTQYFKGSKDDIKHHLETWLSQFKSVQLISDVSHYDMMLFIDIFGTAFDLPNNVCPYCYDINQDIARYENISNKDAFDFSREQLLENNNIELQGNKHNCLYDALVIKNIYNLINDNA